ncbi:porin [Sphingomonas histidinilytica]|uniref:Phosphate-selective porin OprO and OprP n=1 Tax=Rhizorhabdus histidinilytica TaxID=439228 RepID=A0A1T5FY64_9SPHN|nr:porin [Rhizorhabdus histidinilytica]MBO9375889.1 porin [Rhizorhabdus histidinilytica]SKC01106.1 phosphate-selective porin OprO and OprP [Rhizorhabdus histidinilytica]
MFRIARVALAATASLIAMPLAAAPLSAEESQALRDEVRALQARLAAIEARLGEAPSGSAPAVVPMATSAPSASSPAAASAPATAIGWKGSPQFTSDDRSFKVKGRIQLDAGYVSKPRGIVDRGLGFSNEVRRIRLGGEGKLGSGFGYKLEVELSDNKVGLVDTFVTYDRGPWQVSIGNQNQFQSLDELTGDTTGSLMERAAFTDAFNFERRLGIAVQYHRKDILLQAGVFSDDIDALADSSDGPNGGDENNSFSIDGRAVYAPKLDGTQIHLGGSAHLRMLNRLSDAPTRYRQRPFLHSTNSRILATPNMFVDREFNYGLEVAAIHGRWHTAGEANWLDAIGPGPNSRFFGGYAEVGYFLTDDTRTYRNGIFGGAKPSSPFGKGGIGAIQLNLRYDYLDLNDGAIRGGTQNGWFAGIIWTPVEYLRFNLNYGYLAYTGAAIPAGGRTDYGMHVGGARVELDF